MEGGSLGAAQGPVAVSGPQTALAFVSGARVANAMAIDSLPSKVKAVEGLKETKNC